MSRAWMPLYVGDFLADTMHLNCQETGGYLRLLMHAWQHDGLIPDDNDKMARIVRCHPPHWPRLRKTLEPFFDLTKTPGSWYSKRIGLELNKASEISNKRKDAALQKHSKSSAKPMQMHTQSQSQSHIEEESPPSLREGPPKPRKIPACRLSPDWKPETEEISFALEAGLTLDQVTAQSDRFRDFWHAKAGKDATKADWPATWRNWIRRAIEQQPRGSPQRVVAMSAKDQRNQEWRDAYEQLRDYANRDEDGNQGGGEVMRLLPAIGCK